VLVSCASARQLAAQLHGQHWTVTPETERATVGDTVTLAFRVRLDERDLLFDTVPKPARTLPDWIRVFGVEELSVDRAVAPGMVNARITLVDVAASAAAPTPTAGR
jgi:hypothetical protein